MDPTAKAISDRRSVMSPEQMEALAEEICTYHAPDPEMLGRIGEVRKTAKAMIVAILMNCPSSADRSAAIRLVREGMMTANARVVS